MNIEQAFEGVLDLFDGDYEKALMWFASRNVLLGGVAPVEMINAGRTRKLCAFIESSLEGNYP